MLTTVLFFLAYPVAAQTTGTCVPAEAETYLDVNNVRARIFNNGALFWNRGLAVYEVPKEDGISAIFNAAIWIGGRVDGKLRVAAARYGLWQFWPGPLDDNGNPPIDCTPFDHIYEITRADLQTFADTGTAPPNLVDWPWHLGAPVLDGDGNPDNYDVDAGDRPALIGDQMLWWVMNDVGNEHLRPGSDSPPVGMEVHGSAFAFHRLNSYIDEVTFYRYVFHYKGGAPLEEAYFGLYSDVDLGSFDDDYIGADSTLHLGYAYNSDNDDGWGTGDYGFDPPAVGYTFLRTAVADTDGRDNDRDGATDEPGEMLGMTSFVYFNDGGGVTENPQRAREYYQYMQAFWKDGRHVTLGGNGYNFSDIPTMFMFSGDPVTNAFWSEVNLDGDGTPNTPADRRLFMSTGPFTMQPGDAQEITFAIVWARGDDYLDSVRLLKKNTARLLDVADDILVPDATVKQPPPPPEPIYGLGFAQNFPNPFSTSTTIRYSLPQPMNVRLTVFDVLGREVATLVEARQEAGVYEVPFTASHLPAGVYVYRIEMDHLSATRRMLLVR